MRRRSLRWAGWLSLLTLGTLGCGNADHASRLDAAACPVGVSTLAELGAVEDPASIEGVSEVYVEEFGDGGWAVLESGRTDVLVYARDGGFSGILGHRGSGPEELAVPRAMALGPGDSLWVADQQGRWIVFDPEGVPVRTVGTPGLFFFDAFTPSGLPFRLHAAAMFGEDGSISHTSLFVQPWTPEGETLGRIGPGAMDPERGGRVGMAGTLNLAAATSDSAFLVTGHWDGVHPYRDPPGEPGVMRWTPDSAEPWVTYEDLAAAAVPLRRPAKEDLLMRAIGPSDREGGFWVFAGVRRMSQGEQERLETELDVGSWRRAPLVKQQVFEGLAWRIDRDGRIQDVAYFDEFPDGLVGSDGFFSIHEDSVTGMRTVRIHRLERCEA